MIWLVIVLLSVLCGLLGAWAGADSTSKSWRRYGVPLVRTVFCGWQTMVWYVIFMLADIGVLSCGYGIPDIVQGEVKDEGSDIGRFWFKVFEGNEGMANIFTRGTIGMLEGVAMMPLAVYSQAWGLYGLLCTLLVGNWILWGALIKNEGMFSLFHKELLTEEALIHGINTFLILSYVGICVYHLPIVSIFSI